jgi:hypothetical protein
MARYVFPTEMDGEASNGRPFIYFREKDDDNEIILPIPSGVSFGDGGSYSSINMGVIGNFLGGEDGVKGAFQKAKNIKGSQIADIAKTAGAGFFLEQEGQEKLMAATKKILNPNTNTTFEGNTIRSFQFDFTLVGRSTQDSNTIRNIHNTFRTYMYPESTADGPNVILDYPPIWIVQFHNGAPGAINEWIPHMYECYLTSMTTNFNPSALMFRTDYSPAETSLSLGFTETRTLMRTDIEEDLNAGQGGINP